MYANSPGYTEGAHPTDQDSERWILGQEGNSCDTTCNYEAGLACTDQYTAGFSNHGYDHAAYERSTLKRAQEKTKWNGSGGNKKAIMDEFKNAIDGKTCTALHKVYQKRVAGRRRRERYIPTPYMIGSTCYVDASNLCRNDDDDDAPGALWDPVACKFNKDEWGYTDARRLCLCKPYGYNPNDGSGDGAGVRSKSAFYSKYKNDHTFVWSTVKQRLSAGGEFPELLQGCQCPSAIDRKAGFRAAIRGVVQNFHPTGLLCYQSESQVTVIPWKAVAANGAKMIVQWPTNAPANGANWHSVCTPATKEQCMGVMGGTVAGWGVRAARISGCSVQGNSVVWNEHDSPGTGGTRLCQGIHVTASDHGGAQISLILPPGSREVQGTDGTVVYPTVTTGGEVINVRARCRTPEFGNTPETSGRRGGADSDGFELGTRGVLEIYGGRHTQCVRV